MGLDELVNSSTEDKENKKESENKEEPDRERDVGQKTIRRTKDATDNPGPDEVSVAGDESPLSPLQCKECQNSMSVPVKGLARDEEGNPTYGALQRCTRVFCDKSIFNEENPPIEFDRLEIFKEMNSQTEESSSISSW